MNGVKIFSTGLLAATLLGAAACHEPRPASPMGQAVPGGGLSSCPFLTQDARGRFVLSWVRQDSAGGPGTVYYAFSGDSGRSFGPALPIPASRGADPHGENMPKLLFLPGGAALAAFGVRAPVPGNDYTGRVYYCYSPDGRRWGPAHPLTRDSGSYDQRYFDLAALPGGGAGISWLNNSRPEGSTVCFARLTAGGLAGGIRVVGRHACQCCRTALYADHSGLLHLAYRDILHDSAVAGATGIRDMVSALSRDSGRSFGPSRRISADNWAVDGCPHTGPDLCDNARGLHIVWYTMGGGGGVYYCRSAGADGPFTRREVVSANPGARHPQIIALPNGHLLIAWDEDTEKGGRHHLRIGLQQRGPDGALLGTAFVTPNVGDAAFCMAGAIDARRVLLAYTTRTPAGEQVCYQIAGVPMNALPREGGAR